MTNVYILTLLLFGIFFQEGISSKYKIVSEVEITPKCLLKSNFNLKNTNGPCFVIYESFGIIDSNTILLVDTCIRIISPNSTKIINIEKKLKKPSCFDYNYLDSVVTILSNDTVYLVSLNGQIIREIPFVYGLINKHNNYIIGTHTDEKSGISVCNIENNINKIYKIQDDNLVFEPYTTPNIVVENNTMFAFYKDIYFEIDIDTKKIRKYKMKNKGFKYDFYTILGKYKDDIIVNAYGVDRNEFGRYNFPICFINKKNKNVNVIKFINFTQNIFDSVITDEEEGDEDKLEYSYWVTNVIIKYEPKLETLYFLINTEEGVEIYYYKLS